MQPEEASAGDSDGERADDSLRGEDRAGVSPDQVELVTKTAFSANEQNGGAGELDGGALRSASQLELIERDSSAATSASQRPLRQKRDPLPPSRTSEDARDGDVRASTASLGSDVSIVANLTLFDHFEAAAVGWSLRTALRYHDGAGILQTFSFQEVVERALDTSETLLRLGFCRGDRVAIVSENRSEWVFAFLGSLKAGLVPVILDAELSEIEVAERVVLSRCSGALLSRAVYRRTGPTLRSISRERGIPVLNIEMYMRPFEGAMATFGPDAPRGVRENGMFESETIAAVLVHVDRESETARLLKISHRSLCPSGGAQWTILPPRSHEHVALLVPLHFAYALVTVLSSALVSGIGITFIDHKHDVEDVISAIRAVEPAVCFGLPQLFELLYDALTIRERDRQAHQMGLRSCLFGCCTSYARSHLGAKTLGRALRSCVSVGRPLARHFVLGLQDFGIQLKEAYTVTEIPSLSLKRSQLEDTTGPLSAVAQLIISCQSNNPILLHVTIDEFMLTDDVLTIGEEGNLELSEEASRTRKAAAKFNISEGDVVEELVEFGVMVNDQDHRSLAKLFLEAEADLNKVKVGEYLGAGTAMSNAVLADFVAMQNFTSLEIDYALRKFLQGFRLPGEAQKIDRMMEAFAQQYCKDNPGVFASPDTAYVLSFSLIMLNTDAHNPSIKRKMTKEEFIKNNRGIDQNENLPRDLLERLYDRIVEDEIVMDRDDFMQPPVKQGWLVKQGGRVKTWRRRWFLLSGNMMYYYKSVKESKPTGFIPLENLEVFLDPENTRKGKHGFIIGQAAAARRANDYIKSAKFSDGDRLESGHHRVYRLRASSKKDMDEWITAIRNHTCESPFMDLIEKRKIAHRESVLAERSRHEHGAPASGPAVPSKRAAPASQDRRMI